MGKERLQLGKERLQLGKERKGCNCERFHQFWERFLSQERSSLQLGKVSSILVSFPSFPFPEWSKRKVGKVKGKDSDPPDFSRQYKRKKIVTHEWTDGRCSLD